MIPFLAFAWGAFWIGAVAGVVALVVGVIVYIELTDADIKEDRAVRRRMAENARTARAQLTAQEQERVRKELRKIKGKR